MVEDHVDRLLQQRHIVTGLPAAAPPPAGGVTGGVEAEDVEDQEDGGEGWQGHEAGCKKRTFQEERMQQSKLSGVQGREAR